MKVLVIYYKQDAITSTIRLGGLIKYLTDFGWEPIILTNKPSPELDKFEVITVPYDSNDLIKKLPSPLKNVSSDSSIFLKFSRYLWNALFSYPDLQKEWYTPALKAVIDSREIQDVDVVISSFPPATSHLIAKTLKEKYGIPWIADMRDLWTQYTYYNYKYFFPRKLREKRLELKTLAEASYLVIVSKPLAKTLEKIHKNPIFVIPNGFDPENVNPGTPLTEKFSITYAGGLWGGKRDPRILFEVINQLKLEDKIDTGDFEINFFGPDEYLLKKLVKNYDLEDIVNINGLVPREEVIERERQSQLLLLLRWDNLHEEGVFTGKIFEYLAAKRPIMSIGYKGGVVDELLEKTNAGVSLNDVDEIKKEIFRAYSEFKSSGEVKYSGIPEEIEKYSHKEMAKEFVNILEMVVKDKN